MYEKEINRERERRDRKENFREREVSKEVFQLNLGLEREKRIKGRAVNRGTYYKQKHSIGSPTFPITHK